VGKFAGNQMDRRDSVGIELPPPARKTIDLEGKLVKDGVKKGLRDRQLGLAELVHAIREYRKIAESKPLTLQGSDYAQAVQELNSTAGPEHLMRSRTRWMHRQKTR
jgi:hypothetical protein